MWYMLTYIDALIAGMVISKKNWKRCLVRIKPVMVQGADSKYASHTDQQH